MNADPRQRPKAVDDVAGRAGPHDSPATLTATGERGECCGGTVLRRGGTHTVACRGSLRARRSDDLATAHTAAGERGKLSVARRRSTTAAVKRALCWSAYELAGKPRALTRPRSKATAWRRVPEAAEREGGGGRDEGADGASAETGGGCMRGGQCEAVQAEATSWPPPARRRTVRGHFNMNSAGRWWWW